MKKPVNIRLIILVTYIALFLGIFVWLLSPIAFQQTSQQAPTEVPSLSISSLKEASSLSKSYGKEWSEFPSKPNTGNYTFGQPNPL